MNLSALNLHWSISQPAGLNRK